MFQLLCNLCIILMNNYCVISGFSGLGEKNFLEIHLQGNREVFSATGALTKH